MRKQPEELDPLAYIGGFPPEKPVVINDSGECESCEDKDGEKE